MTASERVKAWREKNPKRLRAQRESWNRSPGAKRAKQKWEKGHRSEIESRRRRRLRETPALRAERSLRTRMRAALRAVGARKEYRSQDLYGATPRQLRAHLEAQFLPGMDWNNYGSEWHVDHIRPCASFDLSDPSQQRECFHVSNLRPLWAKDNLLKGAKYAI